MARMGWFSFLGTLTFITLWFQITSAQNILLNGDFEDIIWPNKINADNADDFFAKHWHRPSHGTVDVHRDYSTRSDTTVLYLSSMYVDAYSGNFCAGFIPLDNYGYMEHFTGTLTAPLEKDSLYQVSFYLRYLGSNTPLVCNGIGYKFSSDSLLYSNVQLLRDKTLPDPFYYSLFSDVKIYADFSIDEYIIDTTWNKHTSIYKASGEEKYITFGVFAIENDKKQVDQFLKIRSKPVNYLHNLYTKNRLLGFKRFNFSNEALNPVLSNYYLIDNIEVIKVVDRGQNEPISKVKVTKAIIDSGEITIDKGYVGYMKIELGVRLKPMEKYVLEYGKKCKIIIINTGKKDEYSEMKYLLEYPARKLRKKPVRFYVENTNMQEMKRLISTAEKVEEIKELNFEGIVIKN